MKCSYCGTVMEAGMKSCPRCGYMEETGTHAVSSASASSAARSEEELSRITEESRRTALNKQANTELFVGIAIAAIVLFLAVLMFPSLSIYGSYSFSDMRKETEEILRYCELLFDAGSTDAGMFFLSILAVYYVPLICCALELLGCLIRSKMLCLSGACACITILAFSMLQIRQEVGADSLFGADGALAIGFWISLIGHIGVFVLACKIKDE